METAGQENKSEMAWGSGAGCGKRAPSAVVAAPCPCAPPPQAQVTKLGEEMSLRFLKREAKLCGFLQKSFLALEKVGACGLVGLCCVPAHLAHSSGWGLSKRMKASESTWLKVESGLREELESRWQNLQELAEERVRALQGQCQVGALAGHRLGTWWGQHRSQGRLCRAAGRVLPPGAMPGPGQGCGPADQVCAPEPGVAEPRPAGRAEGPVGIQMGQWAENGSCQAGRWKWPLSPDPSILSPAPGPVVPRAG